MLPTSEQDINPPIVMMAATLVRMAHPTSETIHNALTKAESRLFTHAWTVSGGVLQIESESGVGTFRHTDGDTCDCPTRKYVCWHRGAHFILSVLAAAMIAPIRSHFEPLGTRQPAAAAEDPAGMGNFLDRPEIAGEEEDVPFTDQIAEIDAGLDRVEASVTRIEAEVIELKVSATETPAEQAAREAYARAPQHAQPREARELAYAAARAAGADYARANLAADRAVLLSRQAAAPLPVVSTADLPAAGHRSRMQDAELIKRRRLAEQPQAAPVLWDTSQFAEEDHDSKEEIAEKIVPSRKRAVSPPDPFEDLL